MSQIMKTFTGLFLVLLMGSVSGGILGMLLAVISAQNLAGEIRYRISCSAFAPAVLEECFDAADQAGDDLVLTFYQKDGSVQTISDKSAVWQDTSSVDSIKVVLTFRVETLLPYTSSEHSLTAYAR